MINILIADDHSLIREALKKLLKDESDIKVVAEAKNSSEAIDILKKKPVDLILLDITMPGKSGLEIIKDIKKISRKIGILVLTMHAEERYAYRSFKAGAEGYITKEKSVNELVKAIRKINGGGKYISPEFAEELANEIKKEDAGALYQKLSDREFQVLVSLAAGKKVIEIAEDLELSKSTINTYRARILDKLNLRGNVDLTHYAIDNNLI